MAKRIRPSIIAQRSFSMLTGRPKAVRPLVVARPGQRLGTIGNRPGPAYFPLDYLKALDEARAESARNMVAHAINDLR